MPTGIGKELWDERKKETLPATEVANTVLWINPAFKGRLPIDLVEGKQTKLGMFFTVQKADGGDRNLVIMPETESEAGRSGLIGSFIFEDESGIIYRDLDAKGVGHFSYKGENKFAVAEVHPRPQKSKEAWGLMDWGYAITDREFSEKFVAAGIRTHRVVAIIRLEEIIFRGEKISVKKCKETGIIPKALNPVVEIRAFGTKERVAYLLPSAKTERTLRALEDARKMVAQELGEDPERFSLHDYFEWFSKTLGVQIGKLKKHGFIHRFLTEQNITLDCRIVDLDSIITEEEVLKGEYTTGMENLHVESPEEFLAKLYKVDFEYALYTLGFMAKRLNVNNAAPVLKGWSNYLKLFREAYKKELT